MQLKHTQRDSLILWSYCSVFDQGKKHIHFNHCDGVGPAVWLPGCPPGWASLQPVDTWQRLACQTNEGLLTVYPTSAELQGPPHLAILPRLIWKFPSPANTTWSSLASLKQKLASGCLSLGSKHFRTRRAGVNRSRKQHTQDYRSLERGKKGFRLLPITLTPVSAPNAAARGLIFSHTREFSAQRSPGFFSLE